MKVVWHEFIGAMSESTNKIMPCWVTLCITSCNNVWRLTNTFYLNNIRTYLCLDSTCQDYQPSNRENTHRSRDQGSHVKCVFHFWRQCYSRSCSEQRDGAGKKNIFESTPCCNRALNENFPKSSGTDKGLIQSYECYMCLLHETNPQIFGWDSCYIYQRLLTFDVFFYSRIWEDLSTS